MLFEQEFDQLSFGVDNAGISNTIYITNDPSLNKLTLRITTNVNDTQFTPGQLVPIDDAPNAKGSVLYLKLSALQLTPEEFNKLECVAEGWQAKTFAPYICFTPIKNFTLNKGAGNEIDIHINNLTISNPPGTSGVDLLVDYFRVQPISGVDTSADTTYFGVIVQNPPEGHADLHDAISCQVSGDAWVCNTIAGYEAVKNTISFLLQPGLHPVTVDAGPDTLFTISMVYADTAPGYGALTTANRAIHEITVLSGQNASDWTPTKIADQENPYWTLKPPPGKPIVGKLDQSTVQFNITNIITTFEPGPTILTISYKGVKGYNDGSYSLLVSKIAHASIEWIYAAPNPSYLDRDDVSKATILWRVKDAGTCLLNGIDVSYQDSYSPPDLEGTTTFTLEARGKQLASNGNIATKSVKAIVLPRINSFAADPATIYCKHFPAKPELAWNVNIDSPGKVSLVSSVTGRDPVSYNPVGNINYPIAKPQMITLEPDGVKNPLYMRSVVLSAFKFDVFTMPTPDIYLSTIVCSPSGNFIYGIASLGNSVTIMDAYTLMPAAPRVTVQGTTSSLAISPDGKLLYVTSHHGVVTIFQVTDSGRGMISVTLLTTIPGFPKNLYQIALSPSGDQFYAVGDGMKYESGVMAVYNKSADNQFTKVASIDLPKSAWAVAVSPSGEHIFVSYGYSTGGINVYARSNFSLVATIPVHHMMDVLAITPNGEYLFGCANNEDEITVMSAKKFTVIDKFKTLGGNYKIAIFPSSDYVFISCRKGITALRYDRGTGQYTVLAEDLGVFNVNALAICTRLISNQLIVTTGGDHLTMSTMMMITYEKAGAVSGLSMQPTSALSNTGGTTVLVWQNERVLSAPYVAGAVVINTATYAFSHVLPSFAMYDMVYSRDNKLLYVIQGVNNVITVNVKDAQDYSDKGNVAALTGTPMQLLVNADGSLLFVSLSSANGTKNSVSIVSTPDMKIIDTIALQGTIESAFLPMVALPGSSRIFVAQKEFISILENGAGGYTLLKRTIPLKGILHSMVIFPDGSRIAGIDSNGRTISVINTATYEVKEIQFPEAYGSKMTGLAVSPDGANIIVSANDKGTIIFVDTNTWLPAFVREIGVSPQGGVYLPDGSQIFVSCQGSVGIMKQVQPG